jgi:hypothetical protein
MGGAMIELPEVSAYGSEGFRYKYRELGLRLRVNRFKDSSNGVTHADLEVLKKEDGTYGVLTKCRFALTELHARGHTSRELHQLCPDLHWRKIVETVCLESLKRRHQREGIEWLKPDAKLKQVPYIVDPLMHLGHPTLVFAPGESGKSHLGVYLSLLIAAGGAENGLTVERPRRVLYLDWELDENTVNICCQRFRRGMPRYADAKLAYKRMSGSLFDSLQVLEKLIREEGFEVVIIDSVAWALGKDMKDSTAPIELYGALRSLGVTPLLFTHTPKTGKETAYG